ncbi:MAG: hypothetical protein COU29_02835 [Candidatus Magasanikbacteria bacterium CG10_big_fil_rev_8_21_14_0_10_36_32]|uniref:Uncharacterized protein n=1 Tax=Candidatus Magasanikbacteria bacterium CG10_big_fil_rev_8_21_14_0_10_36_32 TaxID=1974646 RepID=A0A2M6W788_9BACT|nr:MAG: hypothetical protein COU29_02835 [Candidatus Magasanikbacteria bacterium CG10_big_fil_rev_8_21_14_0_10_36_32]
MKNIINKDIISVIKLELHKAVTDFFLAEYFFDKSHLDILRRYQVILRDFSNHYAYLAMLSLCKIFETTGDTNNIFYVDSQLTDLAERDFYQRQAKSIKSEMDFIFKARHERIAHSSRSGGIDPTVTYATYSLDESKKIKEINDKIIDIFFQLKSKFGFDSDVDYLGHDKVNEAQFLVDTLIEMETKRVYQTT